MGESFNREESQKKFILALLKGISLSGLIGVALLPQLVVAIPQQIDTRLAQQPANFDMAEQVFLEFGKSIEREIGGDENHKYQINLQVGQYLHIVVEQRGIDVVVTLFDPNGQQLSVSDSPNHNQGREPVSVVAEVSGNYRLEVRQLEQGTTNLGRYQVEVKEQRIATEQHRRLVAAERAFMTANQLHLQTSEESKKRAISKWQDALSVYKDVGDRTMVAFIFSLIGNTFRKLKDYQQSIYYYRQALIIYQELEMHENQAINFRITGQIYHDLQEYEKALLLYEKALKICEKFNIYHQEIKTIESILELYFKQKQYPKIEKIVREKLEKFSNISDSSYKNSLLNILETYLANDWKFQAAIGIQGNRFGFIDLSWQEQLELSKINLFISEKVNDIRWKRHSLHGLGWVYRNMGFYSDSLKAYQLALELAQGNDAQDHQVFLLTEIGLVYNDLGEYDFALKFFNQTLQMIPHVISNDALIPLSDLESFTLNQIGRSYLQQEKYAEALSYLKLALSKPSFDRHHIFNQMGFIYFKLGEYKQAIAVYKQALRYRNTGDPGVRGLILNNMGLAYVEKHDYGLAEEAYQEALKLFIDLKDAPGEATTLYNIAVLRYKQGNLKESLNKIETAIAIIEDIRGRIASRKLKQSYFATVQNYYEFYIDLLMQLHQQNPSQGYDALAFHASERARARSLLELLTEANADIRQGVDPKLLEQEQRLQQQLNALEHRRHELLTRQYTQQQQNDIQQQSQSVLAQLDQLKAQIRITSPRYAALKYPQPLTLKEVQQQVLDDDTLLLQYSLGSDRSYLWAVTKNSITSYVLPSRSDIETAAQTFRQSLTSSAGKLETGRSLSQIILAPVASQLGHKRLLVVGDGVLQSIPFAALPIPTTPTAPLLVQNETVTLPSASTVAIQRRQLQNRPPAAKTLAVLADPIFTLNDTRVASSSPQSVPETVRNDALTRASRNLGLGDSGQIFDPLPHTRTEAEKILALVPEAKRLQALDFNASRTKATDPNLAQYQIVHLATHGLVDPVNPELSGIVLSLFDQQGQPQDGFLRLHDIFNLNLPAELVVLSACQTGLGKEVKGEGLVGLTRGFMYAGSRRVVVSLWSVNDAATSELMAKFYQRMLQGKKNPVQALREAQLEMWNSQNRRSPYYWAAFTVQGDWR